MNSRSPYWRSADLLAEVEFLMPDDPDAIARRLGTTPGAIGRAAHRAGRPDLARPFEAAAKRARRATQQVAS